MLDVQTIRNLFEAFLQTSFLSPEDVVDLLAPVRFLNPTGKKAGLMTRQFNKIRNRYLDDVERNELVIEDFIDLLYQQLIN